MSNGETYLYAYHRHNIAKIGYGKYDFMIITFFTLLVYVHITDDGMFCLSTYWLTPNMFHHSTHSNQSHFLSHLPHFWHILLHLCIYKCVYKLTSKLLCDMIVLASGVNVRNTTNNNKLIVYIIILKGMWNHLSMQVVQSERMDQITYRMINQWMH